MYVRDFSKSEGLKKNSLTILYNSIGKFKEKKRTLRQVRADYPSKKIGKRRKTHFRAEIDTNFIFK